MANVNIYISDKEEIKLKKLAQAEGKSISAYCREKIAQDEPQEQPLSRVTIEYEIDKLKEEIRMMNDNIIFLSKELLRQSKINSELSNAFILMGLRGNEDKQVQVYNEAERIADEYIKEMFEG